MQFIVVDKTVNKNVTIKFPPNTFQSVAPFKGAKRPYAPH